MKKYIVYVGVVGQIACGKGILVDYLIKNHGFISFSLSSIIHDELKKKGITKFTRKTLQDMGDSLRKKYGRDVLARRAIKQLRVNKKKSHPEFISGSRSRNKFGMTGVVIEGIRNTAEVEYLKTLPQFILIGVRAKRELRFKRLLARRKPWDPKTWEDFLIVDRRDLGVGQKKSGQQVGKCLAYCDFTLTNNKDTADFYRMVEKLMKRIFKLNGG